MTASDLSRSRQDHPGEAIEQLAAVSTWPNVTRATLASLIIVDDGPPDRNGA